MTTSPLFTLIDVELGPPLVTGRSCFYGVVFFILSLDCAVLGLAFSAIFILDYFWASIYLLRAIKLTPDAFLSKVSTLASTSSFNSSRLSGLSLNMF